MSFLVDAQVDHVAQRSLGDNELRRIVASGDWNVSEDWEPKPGFLYSVVRSISARINQNYDGWPADELKKAAHTFIGKPIFVNHQNENPEEARGVVIAARYVENGKDKYIEVIQEVDAERFPKLAKEIVEGGLDSVSMGCEAGRTICSVCNNEATTDDDLCDHVKYHKGEKIRVAGKKEPVLVWEKCADLRFFELSYVFDPADETAVVSKVLQASKKKRPNGIDALRPDMSNFVEEYVDEMYGEDLPDFDIQYEVPMYVHGKKIGSFPDWGEPDARGRVANAEEADEGAPIDLKIPGIGKFVPYKGGMIDPNKEAFIHVNRHAINKMRRTGQPVPHIWSIKQDGRVQGYTDFIHLNNARFNVQPAGARRYKETYSEERGEGDRTVHAGVYGMFGDPRDDITDFSEIGYNPKFNDSFVHKDTGDRVDDAEYVFFTPEGKVKGWRSDMWGRTPVTARRRHAYGETEAPESIDTLRPEEHDTEDDFHHYVEAPPELQDPDLSETHRLDREQEADGLDDERMVERLQGITEDGVEDLGALEDEGEDSAEQVIEDFVDWCDEMEAPVSHAALEDWVNLTQPSPEDIEIVEEFISSVNPDAEDAVSEDFSGINEGSDMKGLTMAGRGSLADRGRTASANRRRQADAISLPYGEDGHQLHEDVQIAEVPDSEEAATPDRGAEPISNTEQNLVAALKKSTQQTMQLAAAVEAFQKAAGKTSSRRRTALDDGNVEETADVVNPELSGTDVPKEDLTGDFVTPDPNANPPFTQPTAAVQAFKQFDRWLAANHKQRTASRWTNTYKNEKFIVGQVKRWAKATGQDPRVMFPVLADIMRHAKNEEGRMRRKAVDLEVAAPQDRIDVEKPVSDVTDTEAQESQYDEGDYGHNAGDDIAKPSHDTDLAADLTGWETDQTTVKESKIKTADAAQAVRLAEAYIKAGLLPESDKWNAVAQFQKMRAGQVIDRTRTLEAVLKNTIEPLRKKVASGSRRGTVPQGIPAGFANGGSTRQATRKVAQHDPANDSALFI